MVTLSILALRDQRGGSTVTSPFRTSSNEKEIRYYAKKGAKEVQIHLINNPNTPDDVIADLVRSRNQQVAQEAAMRLADPDSFLAAIRAEIQEMEERERQAQLDAKEIEEEHAELERLTLESRSLARKPVGRRNRIPMSTTGEISGYSVVEHVSYVHAVTTLDAGTWDRKRGEHELREDMVRDVQEKLIIQALALGGNAVVGVALTWASGNVGGATIGAAAGRGDKLSAVLTGTAVCVERESDGPE